MERSLAEYSDVGSALSCIAVTRVQTAQAQKVREEHKELQREFGLLTRNMDYQSQHARLLGKRGGEQAPDSEEESLLRERSVLNATLSVTDGIIGQATETLDSLRGQQLELGGVSAKMGMVNAAMPALDKLLERISDQKTKERLVLSLTVASCCCFTLWYKFM